jgi:LPXTG-site transpeptidase (sortase) family protein
MGADQDTTNPRSRLRARVFLIGLAAFVLVAAIGMGGYIALSAGKAGDTSAAQQLQANVRAAETRAPIVTPAPTPAPTPTPPFANQSFRMTIDKIGVDAPVVTEGLDTQQVPVVPLNAYEVAWYDFTAQPGTPGNAVFAGHKTWAGEAVFYQLDQLQVGDTVRLRGETDGVEIVYKVTDSFTVREDDPNAVQVMLPSPLDIVTIITCDGTRYYTGDSTFGHDYTERRVVRAVRADASAQPPA